MSSEHLDIEEKIEIWEKIENPQKRKEYYRQHIFPLSIPKFVEKYNESIRDEKGKNYKFLISTLGTSPEPCIYFISAVKPEYAYILHSRETEKNVDYVIKETKIGFSKIRKKLINPSDPCSVYKAIKEIIEDKDDFSEILIDATAGKKAMVIGAAQAGYYLGIDVGYVDSDSHTILRHPQPLSERPIILNNPLEVFFDFEITKGKSHFQNHDYSGALDYFSKVKDKMPDPYYRKIELYCLITEGFKCWDEFNFDDALAKFQEIRNNISRYNLNERFIKIIEEKIVTLEKLKNKDMDYHILNFYISAQRFKKKKRYDLGIFLFYRTIEKIYQKRLKTEYGIDNNNPDFSTIKGKSISDIQTLYDQLGKEVYGKRYSKKEIPKKLGLMDSAIIYNVLRGQKPLKCLKWLCHIIETRNHSIFTHGMRVLGEKDYNEFKKFVEKMPEIKNSVLNINAFEFPSIDEIF